MLVVKGGIEVADATEIVRGEIRWFPTRLQCQYPMHGNHGEPEMVCQGEPVGRVCGNKANHTYLTYLLCDKHARQIEAKLAKGDSQHLPQQDLTEVISTNN